MGSLPFEERDRLIDYEKTARITGIRKGRFIEFDYTVGAPELTVELVMPLSAFREFCDLNHVHTVTTEATIRKDYEQLIWRESHGGNVFLSR